MQLCSLELLILCFSTVKGSENRWVHLNLAYICLGPAFSGLLPMGRISWILNFISFGATMFAKVAQTLFQHFSEKRKMFGLLCFDSYLPRVSGCWTLVKDFVDTWFTSLGAIMFAKVAQTLFQHFSGKQKPFGLLCFDSYLPRISGFWTLVKDFMDTWFHLSRWSSVG